MTELKAPPPRHGHGQGWCSSQGLGSKAAQGMACDHISGCMQEDTESQLLMSAQELVELSEVPAMYTAASLHRSEWLRQPSSLCLNPNRHPGLMCLNPNRHPGLASVQQGKRDKESYNLQLASEREAAVKVSGGRHVGACGGMWELGPEGERPKTEMASTVRQGREHA